MKKNLTHLSKKPLLFIVLGLTLLLLRCQHRSQPSAASSERGKHEAPATPDNLQGTAVSFDHVLKWDAANGATSYNIYWAVEKGVTKKSQLIARILKTTTVHRVESSAIPYYYRVSAVGEGGESALSNEVEVKPAKPLPTTTPTLEAISLNCAISGDGHMLAFISDQCGGQWCLLTSSINSDSPSTTWEKPKIVTKISENFSYEDIPLLSSDGKTITITFSNELFQFQQLSLEQWQESKPADKKSVRLAAASSDGSTLAWLEGTDLTVTSKNFDTLKVSSTQGAALSSDGKTLFYEQDGKVYVQQMGIFQWKRPTEVGSYHLAAAASMGELIVVHRQGQIMALRKQPSEQWLEEVISVPECCEHTTQLSGNGGVLWHGNAYSTYLGNQWQAGQDVGFDFAQMSIDTSGKRICYVKHGRVYVSDFADGQWQPGVRIDQPLN